MSGLHSGERSESPLLPQGWVKKPPAPAPVPLACSVHERLPTAQIPLLLQAGTTASIGINTLTLRLSKSISTRSRL